MEVRGANPQHRSPAYALHLRFHRSLTRPFFTRERISDFEICDQTCEQSLQLIRKRVGEGYSLNIQVRTDPLLPHVVRKVTSATRRMSSPDLRSTRRVNFSLETLLPLSRLVWPTQNQPLYPRRQRSTSILQTNLSTHLPVVSPKSRTG